MLLMEKIYSTNYQIPQRLNIALFVLVLPMTWWLLWVASHSQKVWIVLLVAFVYAHLHNTLFSLLHEAVHGVFAPKESTNELFGVLSAVAFPTSAEGISYAWSPLGCSQVPS